MLTPGVTNPGNGATTYTYDGTHDVLTPTDAKNQQTQYSYGSYGRRDGQPHLRFSFRQGGLLMDAAPQQGWLLMRTTGPVELAE
jgi:YD repeat-containing protein